MTALIAGVIAGLVIGMLAGGLLCVYIMRKYMIATYKIDGSYEDVKKAIKQVIPSFEGWSFPIPEWEFYQSQLSKNLTYDNITDMSMHFVCKPAHANKVLRADPSMGAIMPCTWALYETTQGEVYIAKMNIPLMSKMYTGVIGEVMRDVAQTEEKMLSTIKATLKSPSQGD